MIQINEADWLRLLTSDYAFARTFKVIPMRGGIDGVVSQLEWQPSTGKRWRDGLVGKLAPTDEGMVLSVGDDEVLCLTARDLVSEMIAYTVPLPNNKELN